MSDRPNVTVEGSRAFYRASSAGSCARALAGQRAGMDPIAPSADMRRRFADGHLHETPILEEVERNTGQAVVRRQEEWTIDISPRIIVVGHVDGILDGDLCPVEAKSASKESFKDWEWGTDRWFKAHPGYADQWTLTLAAYGATSGIYAVKNKDSGLVVPRNIGAQADLAGIKLRLSRIDLEGRHGRLPACDRSGGLCFMSYLHDEKERAEDGGEVLEQLCVAYDEAREATKRAEAVQKELLSRIGAEMGDKDRASAGEFTVTMTPWRRSRYDEEKLASVVGGDLEPFKIWSTGAYARVTRPKTKGDE